MGTKQMTGVYLPYPRKLREKPSTPAHGHPMYGGCWLNAQTFAPTGTSPISSTIHLLIFGLYVDVPNVRHADDFEHVEWRLSIDRQDCNFIFNVETLTQHFVTHDRLLWLGVFADGRANRRPDKAASDLAVIR